MGIVLLEAMASGKPVVASNLEGYATVITSGVDGLLVTPGNHQELAYAIGYLLENGELRQKFSQAGLQKAREYAWPQVAQRVLDYYDELIDERNKWLAKRKSFAI